MDIDERLQRLIERHEALSQYVEILAHTTHDHTKQINAQTKQIDAQTRQINARRDAATAFLEIVRVQDRRISRLEGNIG